MKEKVTLNNIYYFLQGHVRYFMYYNTKFLMRKHILEQIEYRINSMRSTCYQNGSCDECGCRTLELQMCNKPCKGTCYPRMMNKFDWSMVMRKHCMGVEVGEEGGPSDIWLVDKEKEKFNYKD